MQVLVVELPSHLITTLDHRTALTVPFVIIISVLFPLFPSHSYTVLFKGSNGQCAHEFILDLRPFKEHGMWFYFYSFESFRCRAAINYPSRVVFFAPASFHSFPLLPFFSLFYSRFQASTVPLCLGPCPARSWYIMQVFCLFSAHYNLFHLLLQVEPTESEDKAELDRFCDAMLSIRKEIEVCVFVIVLLCCIIHSPLDLLCVLLL